MLTPVSPSAVKDEDKITLADHVVVFKGQTVSYWTRAPDGTAVAPVLYKKYDSEHACKIIRGRLANDKHGRYLRDLLTTIRVAELRSELRKGRKAKASPGPAPVV